jgi:enterochelin esterase family protein
LIIKTHTLSTARVCVYVTVCAGLSLLAACGSNTTNGSPLPPASGSGGLSGVAGAATGGAPIGSAGSVSLAGAPSTAGADTGGSSAGAAGSSGGTGGSGGSAGAAGSGGGLSAGSGGSSGDTTDPGSDGDGMRTLNKPAPAPEISQVSGIPHGTKLTYTLAAGSSKIYPKAIAREINVYVPMQYVKGTPAPVIVVQDGNNNGYGWVNYLSNTLDNFIAAKKLPPIVAVFANNGGGDAQGSERGKEYDTMSGVYAEWVDQELLPNVEQQTASKLPAQAVTFTKDPEGRGSLGGSSGGVASFIMAWFHPDLFRRVVGFSPSFVAQESPVNPMYPYGAWNFHEDKDDDDGGIIAKTSPNVPIRPWLECGTDDLGAGTAQDPNTQYPHYDFYFAVTRTWTKLTGKGYHAHVDVGTGAGHVDGGMVQATLPTAILWAWRGYKGGQ